MPIFLSQVGISGWGASAQTAVAVIGIDHYHAISAPDYLRILKSESDVDMVGIHAPDIALATKYATMYNTTPFSDYRAMVAEVAHSRPPFIRLPEAVVWPAAFILEKLTPYTGIAPMVTTDHLKMARKKMFFSSAKAMTELGYAPRPARSAIEDAVAWFRANGMLKR